MNEYSLIKRDDSNRILIEFFLPFLLSRLHKGLLSLEFLVVISPVKMIKPLLLEVYLERRKL
jgi:hypothetical protein